MKFPGGDHYHEQIRWLYFERNCNADKWTDLDFKVTIFFNVKYFKMVQRRVILTMTEW